MPTILVVDDAPDIRRLTSDYLTHAGFRVLTAGTVEAALRITRTERPDLLVLDLGLPDGDGLDVARAIRRTSSLPIVMLTARTDEADTIVGLELGADDYVTKPFSLRELQARVRGLLRRAERAPQSAATTAPPEPVAVGRVMVDLAGHRVLRDDEVRPMRPKAFELLAFLVRNAGQVFSREQLLDLTRGRDFGERDRSIDVLVSRLRRKLGAERGPQIFKTVRNGGYQLAVKVETGDGPA